MKTKILISIIITSFILTSCSQGINKQGTGTLIGGVTGALLGSQFGKGTGSLVGVGAGALLGGLVGGQIGKTMDENDKKILALKSQNALEEAPSGSSVAWKNPDNGHHGNITPHRTFKNDSGEYCREYTQTITIGGKTEKAYGKACRKPDGHWQIIQ